MAREADDGGLRALQEASRETVWLNKHGTPPCPLTTPAGSRAAVLLVSAPRQGHLSLDRQESDDRRAKAIGDRLAKYRSRTKPSKHCATKPAQRRRDWPTFGAGHGLAPQPKAPSSIPAVHKLRGHANMDLPLRYAQLSPDVARRTAVARPASAA